MLQVFVRGPTGLQAAPDPQAAVRAGEFVWADLHAPADSPELREGERLLSAALGLNLPSIADRRAFEESSRFYEEDCALFMTATLMSKRDKGALTSDAVNFILHQKRLITVRTVNPRAFTIGEGRSAARIKDAPDGGAVLVALLEALVERIADVLRETTAEAQRVSNEVFLLNPRCQPRETVLTLGLQGTLAAMCQESLASLTRLFLFMVQVCEGHGLLRERFEALQHDVRELENQGDSVQAHISFLLQAALGLVGAQQNDVLRTVALATIAFAPPTLAASIFGMNFDAMDWFHRDWGPWAAAAVMVAAPLGLFGVAHWRRWF